MNAWQKRPICEGTGAVYDSLAPMGRPCPKCHGERVIHIATGRPPASPVALPPQPYIPTIPDPETASDDVPIEDTRTTTEDV